jgi:hypothetical protein
MLFASGFSPKNTHTHTQRDERVVFSGLGRFLLGGVLYVFVLLCDNNVNKHISQTATPFRPLSEWSKKRMI